MSEINFIPGELIKFDIKNKQYTEEGLASGGMCTDSWDKMCVYKTIDLENFPSFNDFKGPKTIVTHGDVGIIVKKVGRPHRLSSSTRWDCYDVFEIIIAENITGQVFRYNLSKTNND